MICSSDRASVIVLTQKAFENRQMFTVFRVVKVYGMAELSQNENATSCMALYIAGGRRRLESNSILSLCAST